MVAGAAVPGYARLLEPGWLELTETRIPTDKLPTGQELRILHLSDLHAGDDTPFEMIEDAFKLGLSERPDCACLTGDYITRGRIPDLDRYRRALERLSSAVPTFASFGNHDGGVWSASEGGVGTVDTMAGLFQSAGITVLENDARTVALAGQPVNIVGIGDLWAKNVHPEVAYRSVDTPSLPTLVLSHNPDTTAMLGDYPCDLQLSGHTHGGQIVIPLLDVAPVCPVEDRRFIRGLCRWQDRWVYVTRGVGSILGLRFACRPEVSILRLQSSLDA